MALSPGTWLNHYEVLGHLGTGGMGEVYRARDNKLQREVALKVLPKAFAQDPERLGRFRREAQVLAQINHPNIAGIHSVEESGGTHFLVMELAEGETLRDRIKRGPISIEEALDIAKQIAAGLEAAHEKPIVHRDLKPANVKVTPQGVVKILDFGLARAFAGDLASSDPANSPTLTGMTQTGVILGTAAYMSPEQARGKTVDKRTDIWALGCVLYEMLTGKHAFAGEDVTDILASVVKSEPDWSALPATTPHGVQVLLRRCLEKDAKRRLSSAADLQIQMEESLSAAVLETAATVKPIPAPTPPLWRRGMPWVAAVVLSVLTGLAVWNLKPKPPQPVTRLTLPLPGEQQLGATGTASLWFPVVALSPDGTRLVYVAGQLYLHAMDQLESRPIPGTEGALNPFFSPDGQWVGFFADGKLKKVSVSGGAPLTLADAPRPEGGSWGTNDTIVFARAGAGLSQVSSAGGAAQELTTLDPANNEGFHSNPQHLPGGGAVLFSVWTGPSVDAVRIEILSLETRERRVLLERGTDARYVPTGHLIYTQADTPGTLLAAPFDEERLELTGPPVPILEGVTQSINTGFGQYNFSDSGTLAYISGFAQEAEGRALVWVDRQGNSQPLEAPLRPYSQPQLSPDGRRLAIRVEVPQEDIWVYDIPRRTLTRLTFEEGRNTGPVWTPDGMRIVYRSVRPGISDVFWKLADGTGVEEQITRVGNVTQVNSVSPDGKLAFYYTDPATRDLMTVPLEGGSEPSVFLQTAFEEVTPIVSPDGHWVAYASNESGRNEIYVRPFPASSGKWQISTEGGSGPVWGRDGKELFYRNGSQMMAVDITTEPSFQASTPQMLFEGNYVGGGNNANFDISADGQRFLMIQEGEQESTALQQINVVLNWAEELKQRVPVQ